MSSVYLELSPANLVFSDDGLLKISHPFDYSILKGFKSNSSYLPPEQDQVFIFKLDSWSLGVIMIELLKLKKLSETDRKE